ncbi:MAG TPA: hypothetical protein DEP84_27600 [Chloroflexi bacterium]|nr:hypothetical protein [Chloroflexota bacterium]
MGLVFLDGAAHNSAPDGFKLVPGDRGASPQVLVHFESRIDDGVVRRPVHIDQVRFRPEFVDWASGT